MASADAQSTDRVRSACVPRRLADCAARTAPRYTPPQCRGPRDRPARRAAYDWMAGHVRRGRDEDRCRGRVLLARDISASARPLARTLRPVLASLKSRWERPGNAL